MSFVQICSKDNKLYVSYGDYLPAHKFTRQDENTSRSFGEGRGEVSLSFWQKTPFGIQIDTLFTKQSKFPITNS